MLCFFYQAPKLGAKGMVMYFMQLPLPLEFLTCWLGAMKISWVS